MSSVRERRALSAAVLLSGSGEVLDFLLPLFAGAALKASPTAVGALLAAEVAVSLLARPVTGALADRFERRTLAACGALLYALACTGYALTGSLPAAFAAAVVSGLGGALVWVPLRSLVGERLTEDSSVFARLVAAEETGGWAVFVPAVLAVGVLGYQHTFLALAACSLIAALILARAPRRPASTPLTSTPPGSPRSPVGGSRMAGGRAAVRSSLVRRLSPMLAAVAATMVAESAIGVLLLLHLQREFGMEPLEIATVFFPGAIAMSVLPPYLHRWVLRYGRARMLAAASVASATFAAALAMAPNPPTIAICWIAAAAAWAVVLPVQQAVIAEASGPAELGRGLGWYESATLAGTLIGSLAAGVLYEAGSWPLACLVFTAVILSGAVCVPAAIRRLDVPGTPPPPPTIAPAPAAQRDARQLTDAGPDAAGPAPAPAADTDRVEPPTGTADTHQAPTDGPATAQNRHRPLIDLLIHAALFATALIAAWLIFADLPIRGILGFGDSVTWRDTLGNGPAQTAAGVLRTWWIILIIDVVWTLAKAGTTSRSRDHAPLPK
ncbi:MFS transporter [Actinoplanes sp. NEAU-A12]|uniref:MFS transporter n=1 Tax=Actinoplanes sandaracinus TaxID=3045177 RepID=A0ABT6X1S1_9ACTN|nr:MFS transporter [Actinoplanes sandaracinus]MDI6105958.1 MFS transporter [Actinoplanes sandaracinus]